jgi:hypothetical protein
MNPELKRPSWRRATWLVLVLAAVLRVILVLRGGQFSQLDENRYADSREAARELALGHLRHGLALPLEKGDHVGFKELGLIPALLERASGRDQVWIPGLFFGTFSVLVIGLLGGIAWRLTGSRRTQFWAVATAAGSGTLFYFARHLLPYDAAMASMLLGLYLAVGRELRVGRLLLAGACVGFGFVIYYGYWTLGGALLVLATLCGTPGWRGGFAWGALRRGVALAAGLVAALAVPVIVNRAWGTGRMVEGARKLSGSIITGDFRGHVAPWEYLWATDRLELPLAVAFMAAGLAAVWRRRAGSWTAREAVTETAMEGALGVEVESGNRARAASPPSRWRRPETINFSCFVGLYALFIITGTWLHKFAVHDRLIRQLLPFLVLGCAYGIEAWLAAAADHRSLRRRTGVMLAVLAVNSAWAFATPLAQEWPESFKRRGYAMLAARSDPVSADSYFRFVNVLEFYSEPEVLKLPPLETLLAAPHFYQYRPYLFEARTPADRARREAVDSSMRLVKMPILPRSRIRGDRYGMVTLHLRLPVGRLNYLEPLLSLGPPGDGDLFFIRFYSDESVAFGFFSTGQKIWEGPRVAVAAGSAHEVQLLCGDLIPAGRGPDVEALRRSVLVKLDGEIVLDETATPKNFPPEQVYAGVVAILGSYTTADFSGEILDAGRDADLSQFLPGHVVRPPAEPKTIRMRLVSGSGQPKGVEPLAVAGLPGHAALVFLRRVADGRVRVGCELWGLGEWESAPVATRSPQPDRVEVDLGPLFPEPGSPLWGAVSRAEQVRLKRSVVIRWNGQEVLHQAVPDWSLADRSIHFGVNPVGGSFVGPSFGGRWVESGIGPLQPDRP